MLPVTYAPMDAERLSVLYDHYRDSFATLQRTRAARDRYLYLALAVLAVALFDFALPQGFEVLVADTLKSQIPFATALDVGYLSSLLLFLLLGFAIRYCQSALAIQRQDACLRKLEALLSSHLGGAFSPEGDAQIDSPFFLEWAHYLYSFLFPLLLAGFTVVWTYRQTPASWR